MQFLIHGAVNCDDPGVFIAFEETVDELAADFTSFGYDVKGLISQKRLFIDHIDLNIDRKQIVGDYDLQGLLARLKHAIKAVGAKRVFIDSIGTLFNTKLDPGIVRDALEKLFTYLKECGMTVVLSATSEGEIFEHGLGRSLSDCIIQLGMRVEENISSRFVRIIKYRGSGHGMDEFPFLIFDSGILVLPITSVIMEYKVSRERVSSGLSALDDMLGGGYFRGSGILISGEPGTGKTSAAAQLASSTCQKGERCLYFSLEESSDQLIRNMGSIGLDLSPFVRKGLLQIHAMRPTMYGLEMHLVTMQRMMAEFKPHAVIIDPVSNLPAVGSIPEVRSMLSRLIYFMKANHVTAVFTALMTGDIPETQLGISSFMDTWIQLTNHQYGGELTRLLSVVKSRGMAHSNQQREFTMSDDGIRLVDVYVGPQGILTGSARAVQQVKDEIASDSRRKQMKENDLDFENVRRRSKGQMEDLRIEVERARLRMERLNRELEFAEDAEVLGRKRLGRARQGKTAAAKPRKKK